MKSLAQIGQIEVIPKIRANEAGPSTNCFTQHIDLQEIQWINWGETVGEHYEKRNALPAHGCINMLYKVVAKYTAKFLAGHSV